MYIYDILSIINTYKFTSIVSQNLEAKISEFATLVLKKLSSSLHG